MCQSEIRPDSDVAEAVTVLRHNVLTLQEQLINAVMVLRAKDERLGARELEAVEEQFRSTVTESVTSMYGRLARKGRA